jgi:membrane fusion protein (multidrug efflux system)
MTCASAPRPAFSSAFVLALLLTFAAGCDRSESRPQAADNKRAERLVKVSVMKVEPAPMNDILLLPGDTEAWQDVRLAADKDGRVEWIGPKEGDAVRKGELIAKIDAEALKAALERAQSSFRLTDELYQRRQTLYERRIISKEELDRSVTERAVAEANLRQAKVEYERGFLHSPINGIVNHLYVDPGEYVARGAPVAELVSVDRIKINLNVPEVDVRYLRTGQPVMVTVDALPDRRMSGVIDFVAYKADPATKTFQVKVLVENPAREIRPGMIARVALLRRTIPDAVAAPLFSLVDKGGERYVFVEKDGVAHARLVSLGVIEGDRIQITAGLEPGENLIVAGQTEVEEGARVQVQ